MTAIYIAVIFIYIRIHALKPSKCVREGEVGEQPFTPPALRRICVSPIPDKAYKQKTLVLCGINEG